MNTYHILLVVTSAERMGDAPDKTGSWFDEIAAPYYTFLDARCDITIASPKGGIAPLDETSLLDENASAATRRFDADAIAKKALADTHKLSTLDYKNYDAIFFAGGHGAMEDFTQDAAVTSAVEYFYTHQKPLSTVCHGQACLISAKKKNGEPLIHGHNFTCFSDKEETAIGYEKSVPFLLEAKLKEQGGIPHMAAPSKANTIVEGALITGQNPASSIAVAEAVIHQLRHSSQTQHAA